MEYNSEREKLKIPAYGRNVQKMIDFTASITNRELRNKMAEVIVRIMSQINPNIDESGDYLHTLWDHMIIISDFKLDVDNPYPAPSQDQLAQKPKKIPYSEDKIKYRHYGKNIDGIVQAAIDFPEGPEKEALIKTIANHMKKLYLTWNRESVSDVLIRKHLRDISHGKLELPEEVTLTSTSDILTRNKPKRKSHPPRRGSNGKRKNYGQKNF